MQLLHFHACHVIVRLLVKKCLYKYSCPYGKFSKISQFYFYFFLSDIVKHSLVSIKILNFQYDIKIFSNNTVTLSFLDISLLELFIYEKKKSHVFH